MISFRFPENEDNRLIIDFENEDLCFMNHIISIMAERNRLLKEIEAKKEKEFPYHDYHHGNHMYCRKMTDEELEEENKKLYGAMKE